MPYPGQFVILKKPLTLPGFRTLPLSDGWVLSCHEALNVFYLPKHELLLLGLAWQTLPGRASPERELEALSEGCEGPLTDHQLMELEQSWCGRYVLICGERVFLDACGLMPVFRSAAGISCNLTLLAEAMGLETKIYKPGKVMNWMPGPLTPYPEITRAMPSQICCFKSGETRRRPLLSLFGPNAADGEERVRLFADVFANSLRNMRERLPGHKFLLALTGGYDSRALFALAKYAGLDFDAYTLEYDGIYLEDMELPKELCRLTGTAHHFIPRDHSRYSAAREEEYLRHTAGLIRDADRLFHAHGQYQELAAPYDETALLRGSIWETAVEFYGRSFDGSGPKEDFYDWFCVPEKSMEKRSLEQYFAWQKRFSQPELAPCDAFYWEQRAGCWLSAIEDGFDLLAHTVSLQPANCRLLISMLLEFPREERIVKEHQARIIRFACPAIADVPFGKNTVPDQTILKILRHKLSRLGYRIRTRGLLRTLSLYSGMMKEKN